MFYVYVHRASNNVPFYVGKEKGRRAYRTYGKNKAWNKIAQKGYTIEIIFESACEQETFNKEKEIIAQFRKEGINLCNRTAGGQGVVPDEETRQKMIQNNYKKWENPEYRKMMTEQSNRIWQDEKHRELISETTRDLWKDPKIRDQRMKRWKDPNFVQNFSKQLKEKWKDPKYREHMIQERKNRWKNPEYKKKMSKRKTNGRVIKCLNNGVIYTSAAKAGEAFGISHTTVLLIAKGKQAQTRCGLKFCFVE